MSNLRRLVVTICLTAVLAITAFAGETSGPPCAPPDPGETSGPPCSSSQITTDDSTPGETLTPPAADTLNVATVVEDALTALLSIL